jgi:hypothetical protein
MQIRLLVAAGAMAALAPGLLVAQQRAARPAARPLEARYAGPHREGSWELTWSAGVMVMDRLVASDRVVPAGVIRLGYNISPTWSVSVGAGLGYGKETSPAGIRTSFVQPFAAVTWTPDLNRTTSPFITIGGGGTMVYNPRMTAQYGAHVGAGIRHMIGARVAVRVEGREQYEHFQEFSNAVFNGTATAGLSFFIGGGPPKDSDGDGVPDRFDRCPGTPRGATVDARGCPVDSDQDAVPDGLDRCASTPAGVRVDAGGCPLDGDRDGVPDFQDKCADTPADAQVYPVTEGARAGCPVDQDGDGVPDFADRCANTQRGAPVDAHGCPRDEDGDGVPDFHDRCPDTPQGVLVDASGCPIDSDHDGVADHRDKCPDTGVGVPVDADGCPVEKDADGDGVPDARDACSNTPRGVRVDLEGCPLYDLPAVGATKIVPLAFRTVRGAQQLTAQAQAELDKVAIAMKLTAESHWEIGGHTGGAGSAARNLRLSLQRAEAVRTYLVARGVEPGSLTAVGYGVQHPIATNRTAAGRRQNTRVEIKRLQ